MQQGFGNTGTNIIGTRHGEKLYETLMTREECLKAEDMGVTELLRILETRIMVDGDVHTIADKSYASYNMTRLNAEGTVKKILTTDYVKEELTAYYVMNEKVLIRS